MSPAPPAVTDSYQEYLARIAAAAERMADDIRALREAWDTHAPVLRGYQTGGLLGARAARKAAAGQFQRRQPDESWQPITEQEAISGGWGNNGRT